MRFLRATHRYVPTRVGFLCLAIILDVFSRRIVGWAMANQQRTERVVEALEMRGATSAEALDDCLCLIRK